jgi:hypothetical protein
MLITYSSGGHQSTTYSSRGHAQQWHGTQLLLLAAAAPAGDDLVVQSNHKIIALI